MAVNVALRVWLPSDSTFHVVWIVPAVEAVLVVMLVTAHPGGVADHRRLRRPPSWSSACSSRPRCGRPRCSSTALIRGTGVSKSPSRLLASGAVVWLGNNLAFALLYRLMDGGGPVARRRLPVPVDFAFIQQLTPERASRASPASGDAPAGADADDRSGHPLTSEGDA